MTSPLMPLRRSSAQVWASVLILLSAAMGVAAAVVAATVIGSINEQFDRIYDRIYGSAPTEGMTFGVVITIIVSVLMVAFGVWYYVAGWRTDSAAVTAVWVLFGIVVCTAFVTPGWFTGESFLSDPGGSGMFAWRDFVKLIPNWLPTTSLTLAIGKVVTFFAAALVLSASARSRAAALAAPPAPDGSPAARG